MRWKPVWNVQHFDGAGHLVWQMRGIRNVFHDDGERWLLQTGLSRVQTVPANLYLGLDNRAAIAETDVPTSIYQEPTGNGYVRKAIPSNETVGWTLTLNAGDYQLASSALTFVAAGGSWGPVTRLFLCSSQATSQGRLLASVALSSSRTLNAGDTLRCNLTVKISE